MKDRLIPLSEAVRILNQFAHYGDELQRGAATNARHEAELRAQGDDEAASYSRDASSTRGRIAGEIHARVRACILELERISPAQPVCDSGRNQQADPVTAGELAEWLATHPFHNFLEIVSADGRAWEFDHIDSDTTNITRLVLRPVPSKEG